MTKLCIVITLLISVSGNLYAQENGVTNEEKIFDNHKLAVSRRFFINFDKGNKLEIELAAIKDLEYINADSLFQVVLKDIDLLKDSISDDNASIRIDYITTGRGNTKLRILRTNSKGPTFIIHEGNIADLKTEQDTINILYYIPNRKLNGNYDQNAHFIHFVFFINQLSELNQYLDGRINSDLSQLRATPYREWVYNGPWKGYHLKQNKEITANQSKGMTGGPGDYMSLSASVNLENYKSYFSPSFSLGTKLVLSHSNFKREFTILWEPHFLFNNSVQGNLKTYRNDFISLTFGQGPVNDNDSRKDSYLLSVFSVGYLVHRQGAFFDPNSWRISAGILSLFEGKTKIEPAFYFNHFFKGVTPSLKLTESF